MLADLTDAAFGLFFALAFLAALLFFIIWLCHRIADTYRNIAKTRENTQKIFELLEKNQKENEKS